MDTRLERVGRRSNVTDVELGYVYWQTADWLVEQGLARLDKDEIKLTPKGMELAAAEGAR